MRFFNERDVQLECKRCVGVTTDGALPMLGVYSGFLGTCDKGTIFCPYNPLHYTSGSEKNVTWFGDDE